MLLKKWKCAGVVDSVIDRCCGRESPGRVLSWASPPICGDGEEGISSECETFHLHPKQCKEMSETHYQV